MCNISDSVITRILPRGVPRPPLLGATPDGLLHEIPTCSNMVGDVYTIR